MRRWRWLQSAALAAAALGAFAAVVPRSGWVFDDHVLIERNADLLHSDIWWRAFMRDYYATSEAPGESGYYRPVAVLCNAFDAQVGRARPAAAHVTNLVLHAAATLAVVPALAALGVPAVAAWCTALVFAVHPVHAESVAFVSGRVDVLATLFVLLAMGAAGSRRRGAWIGVGVASLLAFLSKEITVVLPALLGLVWWRQGRGRRDVVAPVLALLGAIIVALGLRAVALPSLLPTTAQGAPATSSPTLPLQTLVFTLMSLFAPVTRIVVEPDPARLGTVRAVVGLLIAGAAWAGAAVLWPNARAALRTMALAGGIALLPVLNVLPQETRLSERFLYLTSVFLLVPLGLLVQRAGAARGRWRWLLAGGVILLVGWLLGVSMWRGRQWREDLSVWQQAVREEPERAAFWDRLGLTLTERRAYGPAEEAARRAVQLDPNSFNAWHNLGVLLQAKRAPREAVEAFRRAVELQPTSVSAQVHLGRLLVSGRDFAGALAAFDAALAVKPDHFEALRMAGMVALRTEDFEAAARYLEAARRLEPDNRAILQALERLEKVRQQP